MQEKKRLELLALYNANRNRIEATVKACGPNMLEPFYISSITNYWKAPKKVVFVGQQTGEWTIRDTPEGVMNFYRAFTENTCERGGSDKCRGAFWSLIRRFEKSLGHSPHSSPWLNVDRCAEKGGGATKMPSRENLKRLSQLDYLLLEELKIMEPDCIIFFTGPAHGYDQRIDALLIGKVYACEGFNPRHLHSRVSPVLKARIFRTYHPTYLRRSKMEGAVLN